jgi:Mn-dependent DtxR family transcriptional regulator
MIRRLHLLLALALALALGGPGLARAGDNGSSRTDDNIVQAINTKSGSSLFKFAFSLRKVTGNVVDNTNAAIAYSSCENCRTTAIAIQIVLVVGSPDTVTPTNAAIAINENCTLCQSFATAFQFVIGVKDESVELTRDGKRELRKILREFRALKHHNLTLQEFHARTTALGDRLRQLLKTQLVSRRDRRDHDDDEDVGDEQDQEERPAPPADPATTTSTEETTTETATTESTTTETTPPPATTETAPTTTTTTTTP